MTDASNFRPFAFVLAVPDLISAAAYFRDVLGFTLGWEDVPGWRLLSRGQVNLMIGHCPDALRPAETGDHSYFAYLHVDDVDAVTPPANDRTAFCSSNALRSFRSCVRWVTTASFTRSRPNSPMCTSWVCNSRSS